MPQTSAVDRAAIEGAASEAHYHRSSLDQAEEAAQAGLAFLGSLESASTAARARLVNQLGKIALARADYATALNYYEQNLGLATKAGLHNLQAMAHVNICIVLLRRGEPKDAERHLDACIRTAREIGDLPTMAFASMTAGGLHHQRGQLGQAIEAYRECRSLFRRLGNRTQLARALHNLATLYLVCGDITRAKAYNNEAYRLAKQSGVGRILALATVVDGLLEAESGEVETGEARLREGMHLQSREGVERPLEAMIELAEFQLRFRSVAATADVLDEVERGLELHDSAFLRARADLMRGRLMVEQGEDGSEVLTGARDRFAELDRRLFVRDAEIALAHCRLRRGQREACRLHLRAARAIQDEVAAGLPEELSQVFMASPQQKTATLIEDELEGRTVVQPAGLTPTTETPSSTPDRDRVWRQRYGNIIGESGKLYRVFKVLDRVCGSDDTVLVCGESGTGKELVAEAIHRNSPRADGPFVKLNCAALVESLLLSELFGHERGSFTGAHQRKIGRFEMAAGGTIFLDEIGDISPKTQVALLRVLQEREFERVGGGKPIKVDARIIFATNRNLLQMVREGSFREDLYYRLKGICIDLPPLRERQEDIRALADHFLERYASESGSVSKRLSESAMALLVQYPWPGNIRELENIVRSVALLSEGQIIEGRDFDDYRELFRDTPWQSEVPTNDGPSPGTHPAQSPDRRAGPALPVSDRNNPSNPASHQVTVSAGPSSAAISDKPGSNSTSAVPLSRTADEIRSDLLLEVFNQGVPLPELKKRIQ
ncbi:MAG: sigma 54-interacting transcriptional regulator, partial [Myxococcota bacterium]